jgi:hypothetical protein
VQVGSEYEQFQMEERNLPTTTKVQKKRGNTKTKKGAKSRKGLELLGKKETFRLTQGLGYSHQVEAQMSRFIHPAHPTTNPPRSRSRPMSTRAPEAPEN